MSKGGWFQVTVAQVARRLDRCCPDVLTIGFAGESFPNALGGLLNAIKLNAKWLDRAFVSLSRVTVPLKQRSSIVHH